MAIYLRVADLCLERLSDQTAAIGAFERVLAIDPGNQPAIDRLLVVHEQRRDWDKLLALKAADVERTPPAGRAAKLIDIARLVSARMKTPQTCARWWEKVLDHEPDHGEALRELGALYEHDQAWDKLAHVVAVQVDVATDEGVRVAALERLGQICTEKLEDRDRAIAVWRRVLAIDDDNHRALDALGPLYCAEARWDELEALHRARGQLDEYVRVLKREAEASRGRPGFSDDRAIELWNRVLDLRRKDPQALEALGALYARRERWEEQVGVLERHIAATLVDHDRIPRYKQLGRVWEDKLGRNRNALAAWLAADRIDGNDLETLRALARLYRATQTWRELSQTLRRILELGQMTGAIDEAEALELQIQLGQLESEVPGRVDDAVEVWRRVIAIAPGELRALTALEALFTREGRWEEAIGVLENRALVLDDDARRREVLLQAAAIWEDRVEDPTRAAQVYERVRGSDPSNATASERLEAIYTRQRRWNELIELLLERCELRPGIRGQIAILNQVARIYESEIGDQESAFYVLQAAWKRDHAHGQTLHELERLATATGRWQELIDEYNHRVRELERDDRGSAADLWVRIGRGYAEHLPHLESAIDALQQALRIDPGHTGALAGLAELQRTRGSWSELVETLQRRAAVEQAPDRKAALCLQRAELLEREFQDLGGAIHAYQQALVHDPASRGALVALDRLYRRTEQWEPLTEVLSRRAELETDEASLVKLRLEIAQIWDVRICDAGKAIHAYQAVLRGDPNNLTAVRALETLYRKTYQAGNRDAGRWQALIETYTNHIRTTTDVQTRIDRQVVIGMICDQELGDVDRAIEAYTDVLQLDPDEPRALDALGRLYERTSAWDRALDMMAHLTTLTADPRKQVELYGRMARIQYAELGDADTSEANLLRGLAVDPGHVPTMEALGRQYSDRGDWLKAAQMRVRAESYAPIAVDKVRLLFEAARIYQDRLRQHDAAEQLYAAVIALDPEHVEAGRPLADLYFAGRRWGELSPVIDMLCRKADALHADPRERNELYYRAARTADELGDHEKALGYYQAAYDLDATYLPTLIGRADLLFKMADYDSAGKLYQTILVQHRDGQGEADVVQIYHRLGMVRQALGERKKALSMFEKALEIDPTHRDTLQAVIDLQQQQGDWEAVIHAERGLMAMANVRDKAQLLSEIGGIYHEKLHNPQSAIAAYLEALEIAPEDIQLLQAVLNLYTETRQWKKAIETIERFIALEPDPLRRGAYYHAAATVCRDELRSLDEAVAYYNKALDSFFEHPERLPEATIPRALRSFEAIDKVLTTRRDWKAQERAYREMIQRLPAQGSPTFHKIKVGLFDGLGEIYRSRLKLYPSAAGAFEIAQQLDPRNELRGDGTDRAEILAELYLVAGPDDTDKAVEQHLRMLRSDPFKYDSYKALRRIYMDAHQYDKTWCMCNTLAFLKKADPDELQFYEQYRPRGLVKARNVMSPDTWDKLIHPDENRLISATFAACWQGVAAMKAFPHKDFGVKRKERRQLQGDPLMFCKLFYYVAQVLNVPLPEVYLVEDGKSADIQLANAIEKTELCPSFVVRPHLLQGKSEREIAFLSARRLSFLRPEYYLKMLLPTRTELKVAALSAIVMVQPRFPVPPDLVQLVQQYLPEIQKRMAPPLLEQLGAVAARFDPAAADIDVARWGHAVEATAHRAGFVVCGDLEVAARTISAEPVVMGGPQVKDKIKELVLFSISEEFFTVRAQMGLTIAG